MRSADNAKKMETTAIAATALATALCLGGVAVVGNEAEGAFEPAQREGAALVKRYPLPNSDFPIALAVETAPAARLIHHSGLVPRPMNPAAPPGTRAHWGDTEAQTMSVLTRMQDSLQSMGLGMGDVIKLTVFLVGDPALDGKMDFAGMMRAYTKFFGTPEQPNLPARSALQVAGLVADGMWVEIEAVVAAAP